MKPNLLPLMYGRTNSADYWCLTEAFYSCNQEYGNQESDNFMMSRELQKCGEDVEKTRGNALMEITFVSVNMWNCYTEEERAFIYVQKLSFFLSSYSTTTKKPCLKLHSLLPYLPLPTIGWHLTVKDHCFFCICITRTTDSPPSSASPLWQLCRL